MQANKTIEVQSINTPGKVSRVNAAKYSAMKEAFLTVLPKASPGLTHDEIKAAVKLYLPSDLFPEGKTSGWWSKTVQLDLEAKGLVIREKTKPLRWFQA